jgi:hypothetical protein
MAVNYTYELDKPSFTTRVSQTIYGCYILNCLMTYFCADIGT